MTVCLEARVGNGGTAVQYTAIKLSSCNVVLLLILFSLKALIANAATDLLLQKGLLSACLPSPMHGD